MAKPDNSEPCPRVLKVLCKIEFFLCNEMVFKSHSREISYYGLIVFYMKMAGNW